MFPLLVSNNIKKKKRKLPKSQTQGTGGKEVHGTEVVGVGERSQKTWGLQGQEVGIGEGIVRIFVMGIRLKGSMEIRRGRRTKGERMMLGEQRQ